jgi:CelD/BcsL family acetyltransferase involved in cellulose biosynthesis
MASALPDLALQMENLGGQDAARDQASRIVTTVHGWRLAREILSPSLEAEWDALFARADASPYQRRGWVQGMMRHVGDARGDAHAIITLRGGEGELAGLFPLRVRTARLGCVAGFIGDKHANYQMPLLARQEAARLDARASHRLLKDIGRLLPGVDALSFINQPRKWCDGPGPLACLATWNGTQPAYALSLEPDAETALNRAMSKHARKILRAKRRKLEEMGPIRLLRAQTPEEIDRVIRAFTEQKAQRFADKGIEDPFAEPGVMDFLREAALPPAGDATAGEPAILWHALMLDNRIIATFAGAVDARRYAGMATSFAPDADIARHSPGEVLLAELVAEQAAAGRTMFDLGVGEARYKASFCDLVEVMAETVMPLTARGYVILAALQIKRMARQAGIVIERRNPRLARFIRGVLLRSRPAS